MLNVTRFLLRHLWAATALTVVVLAVTTFTLRYLLLPQAGYLLPKVEHLVSDYAGRPVKIDGFNIDWLGREPVLSLQGLQVFPQYGGDTPQLELASLYVSLDPWALATAEVRIGRLSVAGIRLSLLRHADGRISVEGFAGGDQAAASGDNTAVALWLLAQPRLGLYSSQVELRDEMSGRDLRFNDVNVELENDGERHRLGGSLRLPAELGSHLGFLAQFRGDPSDSRRWRGELYLKARALRLSAEPHGHLPARLGIQGGEADLELWSHWDRGRVTGATLDLELRGVEANGVTLDALGGVLTARRTRGDGAQSEGWRVDGERLHLNHAGKRWESDFLAVELSDGGGRATAQRLDVQPLSGLLLATGLLDRERRGMVEALHPSGRIEGLELAWDAAGGFALRGELRDWSNRPWGGFPGLDGVNARVDGNRAAGTIELEGNADHGLTVELPKLFRHPLALDRVSGTLQWSHDAEGWRLITPALAAENEHLTTLSRLDARLPADGSPLLLDLQSDFRDGDAAHTFRYLPVGIMPPETVSWLDRAIVGGRVTAGSALFHGSTGDFPFAGDEGRFEVRFNIEQGLLDYQEGWPRLEELEAEIAFVNEGFHAEGRGGRILGGEVRKVTAAIPDLANAQLSITGRADAPAADLLSLLRDTPLRDHVGRYFEGMSAEGDPGLDIDIHIPLTGEGDEVAVSGAVHFQEGALDLGVADLVVRGIDGTVGFDNDGIRADGVRARFNDKPVRIDAYPLKSGGSRVAAQGRFSGEELLTPYAPFAASRMGGVGDWRLDLDIPGGDRGPLRVSARLRSDLKGIAIRLPKPIGKPADEASPLDVTLAFGGDEAQPVRFSCGERLRGEILAGGDDVPRRVTLALGGGPLAPLPPKGMTVSGEMEELDLAEWIELWNEPGLQGEDAPPEVRRLDLRVAQLEAFGHLFNEQRLSGGPDGGLWRFRLEGPDAQGSLNLPTKWDRAQTLSAELEHLVLRPYGGAPTTEEAAEPVNPRGWPAIELTGERFTYDGLALGRLEMKAAPDYDGLHLHHLVIDAPHTHLKGQGGWRWRKGEPESWLNARVQSLDLQQTLATFGHPHTLGDGEGMMDLEFNWPGDPGDFSLEGIEGEMALTLTDPRILDLDPGAGRMLGLLRLDLAGAVSEGIGFDTIRGGVLVANGTADITELEMLGNTADLRVAGKIQLVDEEYDLLVDLTPKVSSSLPLVGVIASANPVVGAALLVADRLLHKQIDKAAERHYTVTGPWDDPRIDKLTPEARGDSDTDGGDGNEPKRRGGRP